MNQKTKKLLYELSPTMADTIKTAQDKFAAYLDAGPSYIYSDFVKNLLPVIMDPRLLDSIKQIEESKEEPVTKEWPDSSSVFKAYYFLDKRVLEVLYKNHKKYRYFDIPPLLWNQLIETDSIGSFLNSVIKPQYRYQEIN
jgi:hypothetical protein